jgi:anti-sigma regulatory factor (Ser/Thr protein kinase)
VENSFKTIEANLAVNNSLLQINVSTHALDEKGNLWVGTRGIYIYEPTNLKIIKVMDAKNGLTDNVNINLLQGPPGYMIYFTPHGGNIFVVADSSFIHFDLNNGLLADFPIGYSFANNHLFFAAGGYGVNGNSFAPFSSLLSLKSYSQPYLSGIKINNENTTDTIPQFLSALKLEHDQNNISFSFSSVAFAFPEKVEYAYWLQGLQSDWIVTDYSNRSITYTNLKPGNYLLRIKARMPGEEWTEAQHPLHIDIIPAFWQTTLFKVAAILLIAICIYVAFQQRLKSIRKKELLRAKHQTELVELEATALRAQMNPHFIFNCLNSIKALIQKKQNDTAADYLTTFSKLIRILFQNADKREVSLYEELETCKLYTELEALRFGNKILFEFGVDEAIDVKDIFVPALIVQPFIENAIWHGLVPKEEGGRVTVSVQQENGSILCVIDDEGIGRELSKQYKSNYPMAHESKGMALSRSRLALDRIINHREDSIEVIDKKDGDNNSKGTTVILSFKTSKE